ncbi:hypothetical protein E1163_17440 [Fulvivirga kasyanovii]|uniref:Antitoxin n=2 Tax=Fulvivirga kasyanovii TaxID=396812 RepID=A0ABW9RSM2_9BACT|nr:DUF6364 family protein [Fulvivirga kasyanovii]MTI26742.1 hypothetical protein [Fulvivirga kasyanovii]
MNTKITLELESELIVRAKEYAKKNKTNLSGMIENYLRFIVDSSEESIDLTPLVKSLSGVIKLDDSDYRKELTYFLSEKHKR